MVTISIHMPLAGISKERLLEVTPVMNELYVAGIVPGSTRYRRVKRQFTPQEAKVVALKVSQAIPEAAVVVRKGEPTSLTELSHEAAPKQLGTALRLMKVADDYGVRLLPKVLGVAGVLINDNPATPLQLRGLDLDWQVAFGFAGSQAFELLEISGAQKLAQVAMLKDGPHLRELGYTTGIISEINRVLGEYDLAMGMDITGWPIVN